MLILKYQNLKYYYNIYCNITYHKLKSQRCINIDSNGMETKYAYVLISDSAAINKLQRIFTALCRLSNSEFKTLSK